MSKELKLPGEKIAFLEEYISGENTFDDGESIRSTVIGQSEFDKEERIASIHKKNSIPIPKIGEAEDFSKLAAFLLSKSNKWITGQVIHVDGGRSTLRKKG